jgi:predicted Rossmann fold flavoprotein
MFPVSDSSQTVIDCLLKEANHYGVEVKTMSEVSSIQSEKGKFQLKLSGFQSLTADFVCVACGGYPKSSMFNWLIQTGHTIEEPVPSLFTFNLPGHPISKLMGISVVNAKVKIIGTKLEQTGPLLITHWGLSGPAILKLSAWGARELKRKNYEFKTIVNWLPGFSDQQLAGQFQILRFSIASQKMTGKSPFDLPQRLWEFLLDYTGILKETRWADLSARDQNRMIKNLSASEFEINGKTTFKEEFVTAGGIKWNEVDADTMMSKKIPGLFFAGEILNVDGITGGFNFQFAWTSGFVAARAIASLP